MKHQIPSTKSRTNSNDPNFKKHDFRHLEFGAYFGFGIC
jgi:hypothetical protein